MSDTSSNYATLVATIEALHVTGVLDVEIRNGYPTAGECTLTIRCNDKPAQSISWQLGASSSLLDDTTTSTATTWSSSKIAAELLKKINSPELAGSAGYVLTLDTDGTTPIWKAASGNVQSVNGKTGAVVLTAADLSTYTSAQIDTALSTKQDTGVSYTKAEDDLLLADKANNSDVYNRGTIDGLLASKASISDVYDKTTADALLATKANSADVYTKGEVYTKSAVYKKAETYSQDEVNTLVGGRIEEPSGTRSHGVSPIANSDGSLTWQKLVERVNGKNGNITLNSADIKMVSGTETIEAAINSKINQPATAGTVGQVLTKTASGEEWQTPISAPVLSVNTKVGDVVLAAGDIKMADGTTTVEAGINNKLNYPSLAANKYRAAVSDGTGGAMWYDVVLKINNKSSIVTLTGSDITVSSTDTRKIDVVLSDTIVGGKIAGNDLTISDKKIVIPVAGTSSNAAGTLGVIGVDNAKGFNVDGYGTLEFSTEALPNINGAHENISAPEYDMNKMYQVGDYVQYKGRYYVCKTSNSTGVFTLANFNETSATAERENMLAQLLAALGMKETGPRTWDNVNNKIVYSFGTI